MKTFNIKTYKMNTTHPLPEHHFFILSKGYNAGKPLEKPCPNCFIISADTAEEKGKLFWICYALWKSGSHLPYLHGSVIPFISIKDIATAIERAVTSASQNNPTFDAAVQDLQHLAHTEKLLSMQIKLINEMKALISRKIVSCSYKKHR